MEEKILGFMEKMYSDFTKRFDNMDNKIEDLGDKIDTLSNQFTLFENALKPKVETALKVYTVFLKIFPDLVVDLSSVFSDQ